MKTMNIMQNAECEGESSNEGRSQSGFSLTEMMIALLVFTMIAGAVLLLMSKSQKIFRSEQGVSEMDQNARLLMDFLTRDIQQSKENGLGFGSKFRSIYSNNGPDGKTDEITIVSGDTDTKVPAAALPLLAASQREFSINDHYVEIIPNGAARLTTDSVASSIAPNEEFLVTGYREDGALQFDFIKATNVKVNADGVIGMGFNTVHHPGIDSEVPFGGVYQNGNYSIRPITIKRYFVDKTTDESHPSFALSVNDGPPVKIARNVVAFQLRYLETKDGETDGAWVKQQNFSGQFTTQAVEVTLTARTEIDGDKEAERLVTLASVVRPRLTPGGNYGSSPGTGGPSIPGLPGGGGGTGSGPGDDPGSDGTGPGGGTRGYDADGNPRGGTGGGVGGSGGLGSGGYRHETRRIGKNPRLGERLNPRP